MGDEDGILHGLILLGVADAAPGGLGHNPGRGVVAGDRQQGGPRDGQGQFGGLDRNRRDPLGRREGSQGYEDTEATKVPGEIDAQRAREIMEAIRKRLSQPVSPRI